MANVIPSFTQKRNLMWVKTKEVILGRVAFTIGLLWLTFLLITHFWPASYWMEVKSVHIANGSEGQPVVMAVDRKIYRPFVATWSVSVREIIGDKYMLVCSESAQSDYIAGANLPDLVTLGWWSNGRCLTLPKGQYIVSTAWHIHGHGVLPDKNITANSNIFQIN